MRIAICDDEAVSRKQLHRRVSAYFLDKNMDCSVSEFSSGEDFVPFNSRFDLVFMDCRLEDGNGIDFIAKIREHNAKLFVLYSQLAFGISVHEGIYSCSVYQYK